MPASDAGAVAVREVRPDEHEALGRLTLEAYRAVLTDEEMGDYAHELTDVADRAEKAVVLVAVDGDELLGGVTYVPGLGPYAEWDDPSACGIRMLAVTAVAQGRGAGTALVRACLDRARAEGRARVVLHSTKRMLTAQRIYAREGFVRAPHLDWEPDPDFWIYGYDLELARSREAVASGDGLTDEARSADPELS